LTNFETFLSLVVDKLRLETQTQIFNTASGFETRIREIINEMGGYNGLLADLKPHPHAFPDISVGNNGIEVKHTLKDTWRSVANSILESSRDQAVHNIYVIFGKMGGMPDVKWQKYETAIIHVRTSHVPRFELEIGQKRSLFQEMDITYFDFQKLDIEGKMQHVRKYAKARLKEGQRLWWLGENQNASLSPEIKVYMDLSQDQKRMLRAEASVLCPQICGSGRKSRKYYDVSSYLLLAHGVLAPQTRDLFTAGSVGAKSGERGGRYLVRALQDIETEMLSAFEYLDDHLFEEYWGYIPLRHERLPEWLKLADTFASSWVPSKVFFDNFARHTDVKPPLS